MRRPFAILLLVLAGSAFAQSFVLTGGAVLRPLAHDFGLTATVERPSFELFGVRWGPLATLKLESDFTSASIDVKTGVGGAIVLPNANWAVKVKFLLDTQLSTGSAFQAGPEFDVVFATKF
jgi:hypothetical protein